MAVIIYVSESATPTVRGKITAKTHPPCPLAAARGCVMPADPAGHGGWRLCRLAGRRMGQYAHLQQCAHLVILALIGAELHLDATFRARREDGAVTDGGAATAGRRSRRQSEPAGQDGRDRTVLRQMLGCCIHSGCIRRKHDTAKATKNRSDEGRCHYRLVVQLTHSAWLVNRSLPVWMPASRCATFRRPPHMLIRGPRLDMIGPAGAWTGTQPILSRPTSRVPPGNLQRLAACLPGGHSRQADRPAAPDDLGPSAGHGSRPQCEREPPIWAAT